MDVALYDPRFGYYTSSIRTVGQRGDFSTSAHPHSILGKALGKWAGHHRKSLPGQKWHLIEIGGGNGDMARTILQQLGFFDRFGLTYHVVEISAPLRERQQEKLRGYRVQWHENISHALDVAGGVALLFSNELVDAYPCRRFFTNGTAWEEIGISLSEGKLVQKRRTIALPKLPPYSSAVIGAEKIAPGVVEIHSRYRDDLLVAASHLVQGCWLTIDYGDVFPNLYHRQPGGTLRGYFHHLRVDGDDLYTRIGQQDLTTDVNFTDLQLWGTEAGLTNDRFLHQRDFIFHWLGPVASRTTDEARLLDPFGAGTAFKVLEQSRNMAPAP